MGRDKNKRVINFKPSFTIFAPLNKKSTGKSNILDEEIEAIYLMDILGLYQEEAAQKMEVSRPTFTRILKNARKKLANALVSGHNIEIQSDSVDYIVAVCLSDEDNFIDISSNMRYIFFYKIEDNNITLLHKIENPMIEKDQKPAVIIPKIFLENNVNFFISSRIGEGLKNSLLSKGIQPIIKSKIIKKDLIVK